MARSKTDEILEKQRSVIQQSTAKAGSPGASAVSVARREAPAREQGIRRSTDSFEIQVDRIVPDPDQPRRSFDPSKIESMAGSLKARGQRQPISVRFSESLGKWVIVSGERRWRGAVMAGLATLKAVERKGSDSGEILLDQLVENMIREDLSAVEKAHSFRRLMKLNDWSGNELAKQLQIAQSNVVEILALLDLPEEIQESVKLEELAASTAYEFSKVKDPEEQRQIAAEVVSQGLTRAQTRERVKRAASSTARKGRGGKKVPKKDKLPTLWKDRDKELGFTIVIEKKKGYQPGELLEFFRAQLRKAEEKYAVA